MNKLWWKLKSLLKFTKQQLEKKIKNLKPFHVAHLINNSHDGFNFFFTFFAVTNTRILLTLHSTWTLHRIGAFDLQSEQWFARSRYRIYCIQPLSHCLNTKLNHWRNLASSYRITVCSRAAGTGWYWSALSTLRSWCRTMQLSSKPTDSH